METTIKENIAGDVIECGVWRGGATILMRGILKAYNITDKNVWVADSFEGLPFPDEENYPEDKGDEHAVHEELAISVESVKENFRRYDLLDEKVKFAKGWFKDTLPDLNIDTISVLRADGDMYESTIQILESLYHKVSVGGFVIIDDYHAVIGCKKATNLFREVNNITDPMVEIDGIGAFWRKTS